MLTIKFELGYSKIKTKRKKLKL